MTSGPIAPPRPSATSSEWRATLAIALVMIVALGVLFDRTWRFGEVFSPADLLDGFYPWAYDSPRHEPTNPTRSDEAFYHQPLMATHWARLRRGDFPQWDPFVLSGTPAFHQGMDTGRAFNPLSLPFYISDPAVAVTLYGPLRLLCAGLLMWLYLRHAGLSRVACAAGAFAFALNGAFVVWLSAPMPTVALWLPLVALGIERVRLQGSWRASGVLALAVGLQFLGAYLPTSLVVLVVAVAWALGWLATSSDTVSRGRAFVLLAIAAGAGTLLAAVALWPMLDALRGSAAVSRSMRTLTAPWQNLATLALPEFWGSPLTRNWWYPADGNYPELINYFGVSVIALAGVGAVLAASRRNLRALLGVTVAGFALLQIYGWPPASWLSALPGLRQTNPYRWNVALAFGLSILAAFGIDAALKAERATRIVVAAGTTLALLGVLAGTAMFDQVDHIRRLSLQGFEKAQLARFAALGGATMLLVTLATLARARWLRAVACWGLALLVTADLLYAGHGFNPTLPRDRYYPSTPAIEFLQREAAGARIAPVGASNHLVQGHVWGVYGLRTITGFDFAGRLPYQAYVARVAGISPVVARWDYVGLGPSARPNLMLLGLLGVRFIVTAPVDLVTNGPGYSDVGELIDDRLITQSFVARHDGLSRVDLLGATYGRVNQGALQITVRADDGSVVDRREIDASSLNDLDWIRFDFEAQPASRGHRYQVEVSCVGCPAGHAPTLLATERGGLEDGTLQVDWRDDPRALWLRVFSAAPDRLPGTSLAFAYDLNIYRNPLERPRAWFVPETRVLPADRHLDVMTAPGFDPSRVALLDPSPGGTTGRGGVVRHVAERDPDRIEVDIATTEGGVIVFSERHHPGWKLFTDSGSVLPLVRANDILMAAYVPPRTRRLRLEFDNPTLRPSLILSGLAMVGIAVALAARGR